MTSRFDLVLFRVPDWVPESSRYGHGPNQDENSTKTSPERPPWPAFPRVSDVSLHSGAAIVLDQRDHAGKTDGGPETRERIRGGIWICRKLKDLNIVASQSLTQDDISHCYCMEIYDDTIGMLKKKEK